MKQSVNELFGFSPISSKEKMDRALKAQRSEDDPGAAGEAPRSREEVAAAAPTNVGDWKDAHEKIWFDNPKLKIKYHQDLRKFKGDKPEKSEEDFIKTVIDAEQDRRARKEKYGAASVSHAAARAEVEKGATPAISPYAPAPPDKPTGTAGAIARGAERHKKEAEKEVKEKAYELWKKVLMTKPSAGDAGGEEEQKQAERRREMRKNMPKEWEKKIMNNEASYDDYLRTVYEKETGAPSAGRVRGSTPRGSGSMLEHISMLARKLRNSPETAEKINFKIQKVLEGRGIRLSKSQSNIIKEKLQKLLLEGRNQKSMFTVSNESGNDLSSIEEHLDDFLNYSHSKLEFANPVSVKFISDSDNAQDTLGKTAFYDPAVNEISLYVDNRHPKDVMRSLSHELVHHAQNCRGEFTNALQIGEQGYAQKDDHLREMEREAYETGNMVFRDWEDGVKQQVPIEEWRRNQLNSMLMERMGLAPPEEDLDSFRCIIESKILFENEEMTVRDAYALISQHPDSDRLLRLPLRLAMAEIEGMGEPEETYRAELGTEPPGMTDLGKELSMKTDWTRRTKPSPEVPEELEDIDVPLPPEEEIEAVAGEEGLEDVIPTEPEDEDEDLPVREWYRSQLNKKLMEGIKHG